MNRFVTSSTSIGIVADRRITCVGYVRVWICEGVGYVRVWDVRVWDVRVWDVDRWDM